MSKYLNNGNLAQKYNNNYKLAEPYEIQEEQFAEEEQRRLERKLNIQREADIKKTYRAMTRERLRSIITVAVVIAAVAVMIAFIIVRYAKITELSFLNAGLAKRIDEVELANDALRNKLAEQNNLDRVKDVAQNELGLQLAASEQIIYISDEGSDTTYLQNNNSSQQSVIAAGHNMGLQTLEDNLSTIENYVLAKRGQ